VSSLLFEKKVDAGIPQMGAFLAQYVGVTCGEIRLMLVLSRKKNESIIIDDHITITVVEIRGGKVRLGIQAPKEIPIHRSEIYVAIQSEEREVLEQEDSSTVPSAES